MAELTLADIAIPAGRALAGAASLIVVGASGDVFNADAVVSAGADPPNVGAQAPTRIYLTGRTQLRISVTVGGDIEAEWSAGGALEDYQLHVQTSATEIVSYGSGDVDAAPSNTRRLIVGAQNDPDGVLDDVAALASGDCIIWFLTEQDPSATPVTVDPGTTSAGTPEAQLTAVPVDAPVVSTTGQTFDLGDENPVNDQPWEGAVRVDARYIVDGAEAWLRYVSRSGTSIQVRLSATEAGGPLDEGPEFTTALKEYEAALTFRNGDREIALPGPDHDSNAFSDPNEPYFWTPAAALGWNAWVADIEGNVTLTLDDGIAALPALADPGQTNAGSPEAELTAVPTSDPVTVDPGTTAAGNPEADLTAVPALDPVLADPGTASAGNPEASLSAVIVAGIPVVVDPGETAAPAPEGEVSAVPEFPFAAVADPGQTNAGNPEASLTAVPTRDPVLANPGTTRAGSPEASLSAIVHLDPVAADLGTTAAGNPRAMLSALVRAADPILVNPGRTSAGNPDAELSAEAQDFIAIWPGLLPQAFLRRGYGEGPADNTHRFPVDEGPSLGRPLFTASRTVYRGIMNMTPEQWTVFLEFYDQGLHGGSRQFEMPRPLASDRISVQFLGTPQRSPRGVNWDVSMLLRTA